MLKYISEIYKVRNWDLKVIKEYGLGAINNEMAW